MTLKQVLIVRKDLKMRKGKIAAQCAHASMQVFLNRALEPQGLNEYDWMMEVILTTDMKDWLEGLHTKICVSVDSEEELLDKYKAAQKAGLPAALITDAGLTEFGGVPTKTVAAIGPADETQINEITGDLSLL